MAGCERVLRHLKKLRTEANEEGKHIPQDVLTNILSRIPWSSLQRFKCVSKNWHSLLRDPYFIAMHDERSSPCFAILSYREEEAGKAQLTLIDEACTPKQNLRWDSGKNATSKKAFITQSCNGLFCLYNLCGTIQLCNPTTGQLLDLPKPSNHKRRSSSAKFYFGFHPVTKEYKVLHVFRNPMEHYGHSKCKVLTLGTGLWRRIDVIGRIYFFLSRRAITVNGVMYLLASYNRVVSFDLKDEKFIDVSSPSIISMLGKQSLVELEGKICLAITRYSASATTTVDMWMLQDFANKVWIHKHHIRIDPCPSMLFLRPKPIFIQREKMWLLSEKGLHAHDLKKESLNLEEVYYFKHIHSPNVCAYVESLASLETQ